MSFILKVALPCPLRFPFDYLPDRTDIDWQRGLRVSVPFGSFMFMLKLLVAFLQAYVFTLMSAIYLGNAVEDHH